MAAPTSRASAFNKTLANGEPSTHGTERKYTELLQRRDERTFIWPAQRYTFDPLQTFNLLLSWGRK